MRTEEPIPSMPFLTPTRSEGGLIKIETKYAKNNFAAQGI